MITGKYLENHQPKIEKKHHFQKKVNYYFYSENFPPLQQGHHQGL
jgi:hypothetical protein